MPTCPACRAELPAESRFCPSCGKPAGLGELTGTFQAAGDAISSTPLTWEPAARFAPGQVLAGRYRIVSRLGKGGMGEVYRADDLRLGQSVALKFLPIEWVNDARRLAHLHEEVKLARQISHVNVCRVYDIAEAAGQSFLSMEFIDGEDLGSLLRRIGRLPPDKGVEIARQLCLGLAAAHEIGVIHRDLKPANIMLDGRGHVRITDFGLARMAETVTGADAGQGTLAYMAPEQLAGGPATVRSDIYALGLVLFEVFTGKKAFQAGSREELARLHEQSSPSSPSSHVSDLDPTVERVILRCLEKTPARRPASAIAVAAALPGGDPLAAALAAGEVPSPQMVAAAGDSGAWPISYALACSAAILVGLVCCVLLYGKGMLAGRVDMPLSPDNLSKAASDMLDTLGFEPAKDPWAIGFDHDADYLRWIREKDPSAARWDRLAESQPAVLYFWYRRSPKHLVPNLHYPYPGTFEPGRISLSDPAPVVPGMVSVKLDLHGRLLELHAVPRAKPADEPVAALPLGQGPGVKAEEEKIWNDLFKAAKLDLGAFEKAAPRQVPPSFATTARAWTGTSPHGKDLNITVEAASFAGRPVFFRIVHDRKEFEEEMVGSQGMLDRVATTVAAIYFLGILLAAAALAPRNLYLGRSDRQGAMRLAFWTFVILMFVWLVETSHIPSVTDELRLLTSGLAFALSWSALLWLTYIALEPYVRQLWPESLITWTRLLAGQWRDPRLGRDVLLGVLAGVAIQALDQLGRTLPAWLGLTTPHPYWDWWIPNTHLRGYWIGNFVINIVYCFRYAFFEKLLLFLLLRVLLRRAFPAAVVWVLLSTAYWIGTSAGYQPSAYWLFALLIHTLFAFLLTRTGILAVITALFVWYIVCFPLTTDLHVWHGQSTLMACGAVVSLTAYGFYTTLAGRSLFKDEMTSR